MTNFGRTAIALTAAAVISLLIIDAAAAKSKKHHSQPAAAAENAQTPTDDKQGQAKDANGPAQKPASSEKAAGANASATPPNTWSDAEIADAKTHCAEVLQRIHAVYAAREPIREGACGAPAPIELISIGQNPEVTFSPPPVVRCDLAETLGMEAHYLHCYAPLPRTLVFDAELVESYDDYVKRSEECHQEAFAQLLSPYSIPDGHSHLQLGYPEELIPRFVREQQIDLLLMGAVARGHLDNALIGNTAERVLDAVECDLLIFKPQAQGSADRP